MRFLKVSNVLALLLALASLPVGAVVPDDPPREEVPAVLAEAFARMQGHPLNLGFCSGREWQEAALGSGIPIHPLDGEALVRSAGPCGTGPSLERVLRPPEQWYFPVLTGGRCVAMLFASREGASWRVDGVGHAGIAEEWARIRAAWPEAEGYRLRFLRSQEGRSDLMLVEREPLPGRGAIRSPVGYLPFLSARVALGLGDLPVPERALLSEEQFVETLRQRVREAMNTRPGFPSQASGRNEEEH